MAKIKLLSAAIIAGSTFAASQATLAYEMGDILIRGGVAKVSPDGDDSGSLNDERGFIGSVGFMVHEKVAVSLGSSEEFEYDFDIDGDSASFDHRPIDLMAQFYPLGGMNSRVQPYLGVGANYARFSSESSGLHMEHTWSPKGELGIDLLVTKNVSLNGFASYTDLETDYSYAGGGGEVEIDPIAVGGGITLRF